MKEAFSLLGTITDVLMTLITNLYVSTGLLGIALAMAIESCCIPLPSEIVMPLAGFMISQGKLLPGVNPIVSMCLVALAGAIGCLLGSMLAYYIGYKGGRPLMLKYGRYVLISQHDADKADAFFKRWGSPTAFFSRLLPVVRTYISLPAGISKMPFIRFCIYSFLGSLPWCLLLAYLGTLLGDNFETLSPIFHGADVVILVLLVVLVVLYVWRHVKNDRKARAEHATAAAAATTQNSAVQGFAQPVAPMQQTWNQPQYPQQPQQFQAPQHPHQFQSPQPPHSRP